MDLTRRGLMGRAIAAVGGGAALALPRAAFAGSGGEAVFELRLPADAGGGADAGAAGRAGAGADASAAASASEAGRHGAGWTSRPIRASRRFELLGIEWTGGGDPQIEVRARGDDGVWTPWLAAPVNHSHGPDDATTTRQLSDPVWTGPAHSFQLRATRSLDRARVVLVDSGMQAHSSATSYVDSGLAAGPGQPRIIARSTWATPACKPRVPHILGSVGLAFVHHTVSSNFYAPSQSAGLIRSICLFHKYGNGWNDIGYNFVVDRYGRIFEARAGGIDEPIVGAQAGGYNVYSTGIAMLGSFSGRGPSRPAFDALSKLIAWKLALHGVALPGRITVEVTRTGAPYSRYRAGARVNLNRVAGHRDADSTSCPGSALYRQLPRLRQVVRGLAPEVSALAAHPAPGAAGTASLTGTLTAAGAPIPGAAIELQQRTKRGLATIGTATTAEDGTWTASGPAARNASTRAVYRGDPQHSAVVSRPIDVAVAPQIALTAASQVTPPGGVVQFTGAITPAKAKLAIVVSQQQLDGTFATARTIRFRAGSDGTFARTIGFPAPGRYQVVAQTAADHTNAAGTSEPVSITAA